MITSGTILAAAVLGTKAFKAGKESVPCLDKDLMGLIGEACAGMPIGSSIPLLKAWAEAWHNANLCKSL